MLRTPAEYRKDNSPPIAVMGITNSFGIAIYDINDYSVMSGFVGSSKDSMRKTNLNYDKHGNPYFMRGRSKYSLSEFIRQYDC